MNDDLYAALKASVSGEVRFDRASRLMYSTDASIYEIEPIGVVLPRTHEDIFATMEIARDYKVPVLPRGGGTSLAGQTVGDAVVIDMTTPIRFALSIPSKVCFRQTTTRRQRTVIFEQTIRRTSKPEMF